MTIDEVKHLATLARIELSEEEAAAFTKEMSAILEYVSTVQDIAGEGLSTEPTVGLHHNIFRKDEVTNAPGEYTEALLKEMPATEGRFMVVKKILQTDS
jgi:aspartyl-tRNA(Asn)/glutamyl-tRNA(Gln) amidotransferase subunit C